MLRKLADACPGRTRSTGQWAPRSTLSATLPSSQRPIQSIRNFYDAMRVFHRKHYAATTPAPLNLLIEAGITLKEVWGLGRNLLRPPAARRVE